MAFKIPTKEELSAATALHEQKMQQLAKAKEQFTLFVKSAKDEFKKSLPTLIDEATAIKLDEATPVEQWEILSGLYDANVVTKVEQAREALEVFEDEVENEAVLLENGRIDSEVSDENPKLDFEKFNEWVTKDIPPRLMEELQAKSGADKKSFVLSLIAEYERIADKLVDDGKTNEPKELPKDTSKVAGASNNAGTMPTNSKDEYAKASGLYR